MGAAERMAATSRYEVNASRNPLGSKRFYESGAVYGELIELKAQDVKMPSVAS